MMTTEQQLAHLDYLEKRVDAFYAVARDFIIRQYAPNFILPPKMEVWSIPHPEEAPPKEWGRVAMASAGAAAVIVLLSAAQHFRPW